jgi:hypothetical protein
MHSRSKKYGKKKRTMKRTMKKRHMRKSTRKVRKTRMKGGRSYEPTIGTYEGIPYTKDTIISSTYGIRNIKEQEKHDEYMDQQGSEQSGI